MKVNEARERWGQCPACGERIALIYAKPEKKEELVIGVHERPAIDIFRSGDFKNRQCPGSRKAPAEVNEAALE